MLVKPIDHETTRALLLFSVVSLFLKEHSHFHASAFSYKIHTMSISQTSCDHARGI